MELAQDEPLPPVLPTGGGHLHVGGRPMRPILSLFGGIAVSAAGFLIVLGSAEDVAGVLLIGAGVLVALLGLRVVAVQPRA